MPSNTTGVYIPSESDLLERYDARFQNYERSDAIREAMELQLVVEDVLDDLEWEFPSEREKRAWVRQALLEQIRREGDD